RASGAGVTVRHVSAELLAGLDLGSAFAPHPVHANATAANTHALQDRIITSHFVADLGGARQLRRRRDPVLTRAGPRHDARAVSRGTRCRPRASSRATR